MTLFSIASAIVKRAVVFRPYKQCVQCTKVQYNITKNVSNATVPRKSLYDINTNVAKDVILYKYENPKFFTYMNIFAVVQYMFWMYLGKFAVTSLKDAPVDRSTITDDTPFYRRINLGENKYRNTLGALAVVVGTGSLCMIWMYTLKSVRFLILNKGGKHLSFVTYAPFGKNRVMKVPIENVCCKETRKMARVQLPLKVKNTWMHYMLDMRGEFKNPILFDCTAGLARKL